jgi:hypothetical protein
MKRNIGYAVFIAFLFFLMYQMNKNVAVEYQWNPTFSKKDKQPLGAYAFDKMMEASWEQGYFHSYESLYTLITESYVDDTEFDEFQVTNDEEIDENFIQVHDNFLILSNNLNMDEYDTDILLKYVEKGGSVFIAAGNLYGKLGDTLNIRVSAKLNYSYRVLNMNESNTHSIVRFCAPDKANEAYFFPAPMLQNHFEVKDTARHFYLDSIHIISETTDNRIVSMRYQMGEGNLILTCNPLIYTNYGILNDSTNRYIWNHLAYLKERPLVRTEYYEAGSQGDREQSEFRVLLSNRPLKWAYYTTIAAILIFMVFTAKRKQRPIPVIKPPANKMLVFVRSIAGLYLQKNNNADIILKKQIYWGDDLKRKYGIDIVNEVHDYHFYKQVAAKTGQYIENVRRLFIDLSVIDEHTSVSDEDMLALITKMNELIE